MADEELCCTLVLPVLTQDLQVKVHAVLSGLVDGLARVFPGILLLHPGNLQHLSTLDKEIGDTSGTLSTALQNHT